MQFSQQVVSQCRRETSCWRIARCNMGCLAILLLHEAWHEVELSSTFRNGLQQLATPLHSVSPLQQLVSQFYGSFNKGTCAHFFFFVPKSIARQAAEKITKCNRASTPNLGNLQRYIFNHCETSCLENCAVQQGLNITGTVCYVTFVQGTMSSVVLRASKLASRPSSLDRCKSLH